MRIHPLLTIALLAAALPAWAQAPATTAPAGMEPVVQPSTPKFIIGVWYQPVDSFDKWKARGINTLVGYESNGNTVSRDQWMAAARKAGFSYIVKPTGDPDDAKQDAADPNLLAWEQPDEPDGGGNLAPDAIIQNYKTWKAQAPRIPVFVNFDGARSFWRPASDYQQYCQGGDWIAFDDYVINRGGGPSAIPQLGERLDKFKEWAGGPKSGKKFFVFIESSDQDLRQQDWTKQNDASGTPLAPKMRGPTADEMLQEIKQAVDHGASGIVYFPDQIGKGWEGFDGTTPEVEAAMKQANAKLAGASNASPPQGTPTPTQPSSPDPGHAAPLDGHDITIDGVTYTLRKKQ